MARPQAQTEEETRAIIRALLRDNPTAGRRACITAGALGDSQRLGRLLADERAKIGLPDPKPVHIVKTMPGREARKEKRREQVLAIGADGWGRFQELLDQARGLEADRAYQGSVEALIAARDLLSSGHPMTAPGKDDDGRPVTDTERIKLQAEVAEALSRIEERRMKVDSRGGTWLKEARDALARAAVVLIEEGVLTAEVTERLDRLWRYELGGVQSALQTA